MISKYTDSKTECPICKDEHTRLGGMCGDWNCLSKNGHYYLDCPFRSDHPKKCRKFIGDFY